MLLARYDVDAEREFEIRVGSDGIARINVDGLCVMRIRMQAGCEVMRVHSPVEFDVRVLVDGQDVRT